MKVTLIITEPGVCYGCISLTLDSSWWFGEPVLESKGTLMIKKKRKKINKKRGEHRAFTDCNYTGEHILIGSVFMHNYNQCFSEA